MHGFGGHVVEHYDVCAGVHGIDGVGDVLDFDFDLDGEGGVGAGLSNDVADGHALLLHGSDVVVFDEDAVGEGHAVVAASAGEDAVFVEEAEAGCGLAGVDDGGVGAFDRVDVFGGEGCDAAHSLEEVEGGSFGAEDCGGVAGDGGDVAAGFDGVAVGQMGSEGGVGV